MNSVMFNVMFIAMVAVSISMALVPPAVAFSPSAAPGGDVATVRPTTTTKSINSNNGMSLYYKNYHSSYYEYVDVDGDRMSLLSLLDPASVQKMESRSTQAQELNPTSNTMTTDTATTTSSSSRSSQRPSPIIQLRSIQDYHHHVLSDPNQLCVIRFSAPWCKVCKTTNVSWERMASKLGKLQTSNNGDNGGKQHNMFSDKHKRIKFLSVSIDGKSDATLALKDMLQIKRVPTGILHHPKQGVFGKKVDLDRTNLSKLKKQLEQYMEEGGKMECVGRNLQSILER